MADKKYTVQMDFIANTSNAQQALRGLQSTLAQISSQNVTPGAGMEANIKKASAAASELSIHLKNALNVNTGNIDLSKFNKSLTLSKTSLKSLMTDLVSIGPAGNQAFLELASSIAKAEAPAVRLNSLLTQTWATIKGSLRWEIVTRGLTSGLSKIQEAYNYAKDLDKSLNSIRIVSDESADSMARFAKQANAAAKELRSTTLDYTDSALVYFQQGLGMSDVLERTDVTVKMANVVGESAQTVSDQLTAIWNNFDDGSKSVEYFADVLTKLGADTASSTDEIAQGLEKFASVANDVGLSYEYATAALTTITATTRQSADVVGTALKTIFSRMQGLKLGDTLEDGTTLNDYSKALLAVGVNIKDDNGELKDMDVILDEVGAKWVTLGKNQRVALAQQVAGVRQYNQFISLMSNYDFFKENVQRAMDATGTLNEQNEIYKESWEAASKAVKVSIQGIYDSIIDDKWIIKATNNVAEFISGIDQFIDSIGGLKTIIPAIGSIFLMMFANKIPEAIQNIGYNIGVLNGKAYKQAAQIYSTTKEQIASQLELAKSSELYTVQETQQLKTDLAIIKIKERMTINQNELTESEKKMVESTISELDNQNKLIQAIQEKRKLLADDTSARAAGRLGGRFFGTQETVESSFEATGLEAKSEAYEEKGNIQASHVINDFGVDLQDLGARMDSIVSDQIAKMLKLWQDGGYESADKFMQALIDSFDKEKGTAAIQLQTEMSEFFKQTFVSASKGGGRADGAYGWVTEGLQVFVDQFSNLKKDSEVQNALKGLQPDADGVVASSEKIEAAIDLIRKKIQQTDKAGEKFGLTFNNITSSPNFILAFKKFRENADNLSESLKTSSEKFDSFVEKAKKGTEHNIKLSETISSAAGSIGSLIFGVNNLKGALNSLNNADLTWGEKLSSIFTGLLTGFPMITKSFRELSSTFARIGGFKNFKAETGTSFFSEEIASDFLNKIKNSKLDNKAQGQISEWLSNAQNINLEPPKRIEAVGSIKKAIDDGIKNGQVGKEAGLTLMNNLNAGMEQGVKSSISVIDKLKGAFSSLIAPPTGVILAITAAIAAIGAAIYAVYKHAQNFDPSYIYEQQKNTLEDYKKAANEASQNLKDFISGFDSYEAAVEKTKDLTNGTAEMSDAIAEANKQAQDLIDKYDSLKGKWHYENGIITFDEGAKEEAENRLRQEQKLAAAEESYQSTKTQMAEANNAFSGLEAQLETTRKKAAWALTAGGLVTANIAAVGTGAYQLSKSYLTGGTAIDNKALLKNIQNNEDLQKALINDNIESFMSKAGDSWKEYGFYTKGEYQKYLEDNKKTLVEYLNKYGDNISNAANKMADFKLYLVDAYKDNANIKFSGSKEEQNVRQNAYAILSAAKRAEENSRKESLTQKIQDKLGEIEKDLAYSKGDFNTIVKNDKYGNSDTFKLLHNKFGEDLNAKNITSYYDEIFGKGASDGKDVKELRKRIIERIVTESLTANEDELNEQAAQALQNILNKIKPEQAQAFSDAVQTAMENGGLQNFSWKNYFKSVDISTLISQKGKTNADEVISNLLGLTPAEFSSYFGEYANSLKSNLSQAVTEYIKKSNEDFAKARKIKWNDADDWARYAKEVLNITEDLSDKTVEEIRSIISEAEKARNNAVKTASSMVSMDDLFDDLQKIYKDVKENPLTWDLSALNSESGLGKKVTEELDNGKEIWDDYTLAMINANSNAEKLQKAFDWLATQIVNSKFETDGLTEATKESNIARLKAMGITNASAVVEELYAQKLKETADLEKINAEELINMAFQTGEFSSVIPNLISALEQEGWASDSARAKIAQLALQQFELSKSKLNLSQQVSALKDIAISAGIAEEKIKNVSSALQYEALYKNVQEELKAGNITAAQARRRYQTIDVFQGTDRLTIAYVKNLIKKEFADVTGTGVTVGVNYAPSISSSKSSGSKDKKDKKEKTDKEFDQELTRYYKLDKLYEKASDKLDDISKAKDRAYGPKHLKYLDQEISATQKLMDINKKYLKQNAEYIKQDLAVFNQKAKGMGLNFSISSLDNLPDDHEKAEKLAKEYGEKITAEFNAAQAAATDRYNASAKDTTASEQYDKDIKAAEDAFNKKSKLREEYLDYLSKLDEDAAKKREKERELLEQEISLREKRIEKITYQVEIIGDATEAKEAFLDWYKELSPYQKFQMQFEIHIDKESFNDAINDIDDYSKEFYKMLNEAGINNISLEDWMSGKISSSDLEKLQKDSGFVEGINDITSKIIDSANKAKQSLSNITQSYIDELNRQKDELKDFSNAIGFIQESYSGMYNLTSLMGGFTDNSTINTMLNKFAQIANKFAKSGQAQTDRPEMPYFDFEKRNAALVKYLDAETELRRDAIKNQGEEVQKYEALRLSAEQNYKNALASGNEYQITETKKVLDELTASYQDAYSTWQSGAENLINGIFDNFSKKVELMFSEFDKYYNNLKTNFDRTKSLQEDYMDDFQKMYEINKLNADIQKSINDTKNVKSKQQLAELQAKINKQAKDQKKMSEYEIQALRKQYELKLAIQQLEDAQNAKSQVRLTRDAEGNFGYMYTADETEIADAQQNLNDKLYEYYKFNTDRVNELSETYLDLMNQMEEEIKALSLQEFESDAAYNQAVERIKDFYSEKMNNIQQQMEAALGNNTQLTEEYAATLQQLGVNIVELVDSFNETILGITTDMGTLQETFQNFNDMFFGEDGFINKIKYEATSAFNSLASSIKTVAASINGGNGDLTTAMDKLYAQFDKEKAATISNWQKTILNGLGKGSPLYNELVVAPGTLPAVSSALSMVTDSLKKLLGAGTNAQTGAAGQGQSNFGDLGSPILSNPNLVRWEVLKIAAQRFFGIGNDALGTVKWARDIARVATGRDPAPEEPMRTLMDIDSNGEIDMKDARFALRGSVGLDDFNEEYPEYLIRVWKALEKAGAKFDTGGYTGAWGSSGRMAMLHEKELVLNKQDTTNLLSSVDILRGISKTLDLQAISARMASSGLLSSIGINTKTPQAVQQDVHISATFPNVNDSREIEEALNNLVNEAVQYTTQQF